jgi:hypothetical protein
VAGGGATWLAHPDEGWGRREGDEGLRQLPLQRAGLRRQHSAGRWRLSENPHRREGIGTEQLLAFTLPVSGLVTVELLIAARLARGGVAGGIDAVRDLVLGADRRRYVLELTI